MEEQNKAGIGFKAYYTLYVIAGFLCLAWFVGNLPVGQWRDIILFIILIIIADSVQISLPRGGASIYASSPIDLAGIILFGPAVMAVAEAISTLVTEGIFQRRPIIKVLFNIPLLVMTVGVAGLVYESFGSLTDTNSPLFLVPLFAAGLVYYLFNIA